MYDEWVEKIVITKLHYTELDAEQKEALGSYCDDEASYQVLRNILLLSSEFNPPKAPHGVKNNLDVIFAESFHSPPPRVIVLSKRIVIPILAAAASFGLFLVIKGFLFPSVETPVVIAKTTPKPKKNYPRIEKQPSVAPTKKEASKKDVFVPQANSFRSIKPEEFKSEKGLSYVDSDASFITESSQNDQEAVGTYAWTASEEIIQDKINEDIKDEVAPRADDRVSALQTPSPARAVKSSMAKTKGEQVNRKMNYDTQEMLKVIKPLY